MHILKNFITIEDLEKRWGCDKELIESFTYEGMRGTLLPKWYGTDTRVRPDGGLSIFVKPAMYLNGCVFDMANVLAVEELNPELVKLEEPKTNNAPKMVNGKFVFSEHQLIKKNDLYKRWFGATDEEIAARYDSGELCAYCHYKGPINGVIWCMPGVIYYINKNDSLNTGLYEYVDRECDYFFLEDVERCEHKYPEYVGNITKEALGLVQGGVHSESNNEPEYIEADSLRKEMSMSPVQFVDYLRSNRDLPIFGSQICSDDDRKWFYSRASREQASDIIADIYIHRLDVEHHKASISNADSQKSVVVMPTADDDGMPTIYSVMPTVDDEMPTLKILQAGHQSNLEPQLAESQKQIENPRQWNEQLAELRKALEEKESRIAQLEKELAIAKADPGTTVNAAKWEGSVAAAFTLWAEIIVGNKTDWKENEFRTELADKYSDYHTKVHSLAWSLLPSTFKHGVGRSKKTPEKSQQSDNS